MNTFIDTVLDMITDDPALAVLLLDAMLNVEKKEDDK